MEFTLRLAVVIILLLIATLVFATLIISWGDLSNTMFGDVFGPLQDWIQGK